jgi:hypothetical protein
MTVGKVKDFNFSSAGKTVGLCKGGMAGKGYAKGGSVAADLKQDKQMIAAAVHKHERNDHPGKPLTKLAKGGSVVEKATGERYPSRKEMVKHEREETPRMQREELVEKASVRAPARRSVPVAPQGPLIALKKGGAVPKAGAYKMPKVMNEFKAGELHSGSKKGPVVTNPKQAVAIAMSEARTAAKKR